MSGPSNAWAMFGQSWTTPNAMQKLVELVSPSAWDSPSDQASRAGKCLPLQTSLLDLCLSPQNHQGQDYASPLRLPRAGLHVPRRRAPYLFLPKIPALNPRSSVYTTCYPPTTCLPWVTPWTLSLTPSVLILGISPSFPHPDVARPGSPLSHPPSATHSHSHTLGSVTSSFKHLSLALTTSHLTPSGTPVSLCPPGPPHSLPCPPSHGPSPVLISLLASRESTFQCQRNSLNTPQAPCPLCHTQLAKPNSS